MCLAPLKPRRPQTQTKHLILQRYAGAWGGIILNGLGPRASRWRRPPHFVYVDAFCGPGRYQRDSHVSVKPEGEDVSPFGSPVIGVRELDRMKGFARDRFGLEIKTTAILCEVDPSVFARLQESLHQAGLTGRLRETTDFEALRDGEIAVLNKDFHEIADAVLSYTASPTCFSLVLLDP